MTLAQQECDIERWDDPLDEDDNVLFCSTHECETDNEYHCSDYRP